MNVFFGFATRKLLVILSHSEARNRILATKNISTFFRFFVGLTEDLLFTKLGMTLFIFISGIVHDAIACAAFLKFHPQLPKQGARVVTRQAHDVTHARHQRHSVEVSNAGKLVILSYEL